MLAFAERFKTPTWVRVGSQMFYSQGTFIHNLKPAVQIASV